MWKPVPFLIVLTGVAYAFNNPLLDHGADPTIVLYNGFYHLSFTEGNRISVWRSRTLEGLRDGEVNVVYEATPSPDETCCQLWAPDFVRWDDRYIIYFTATSGSNEGHRMFALESQGEDPFGRYTFRGKVQINPDQFAIDGTAIELNGERFFVWCCWEEPTVENRLCIARLSDPVTASEDRRLLSQATEQWEIAPYPDGPRINEGPTLIRNGDRTFLVYSCHATDQNEYCLAYLEYLGGEPTDRASWRKSSDCIFKQRPEKDVYGPGHNYFFQSPDGTQTWNLYHAIPVSGGGAGARNLRAQPMSWNEDGTPNLGVPVGYDEWVDPPSGE